MKHVAVLIETSRAYGRGLLRGIARYQHENPLWSTYFEPHGLGDSLPPWFDRWRGDGVLARIENRRTARRLLALKVPVINLRSTLPDLPFPFIGSDNHAVARLAFEHLTQRGFTRLAFCGYRGTSHEGFQTRENAFRRLVTRADLEHHTFAIPYTSRQKDEWHAQQRQLSRWLAGLTKPVGILTINDDVGLRVLEACRRIGAAVPDDIAVLGVENDEHACNLALPPLSSIDLNSEATGYRAAKLLDRLMRGKAAPRNPRREKPGTLVVRRSTDVLAIEDDEVVRAHRFIREHACRPIDVGDVLRHVSRSRSSLGPRYRQALGHTLHEAIQQARLDTARQLLAETDLPIKQIASQAGFGTIQYFARVFRNNVGEPPAAFRNRCGK